MMSLVLQSFTGSAMPAAGGATAAGGTAAASGSATAVPFAQTLDQSMGDASSKGMEMPLLGNLATLLQGLMNTVQNTGGEAGQSEAVTSKELLEGLVEDLEKLDESIGSDPALLSALQGWILQVSALLDGSTPSNVTTDEPSGSDNIAAPGVTLSPLAENPETIRFAVQDELNSLVSLIQQSSAGGKEDTAAKGIALLNSFTAIVAENAAVPDNKPKRTGVSASETPVVSLKQQEPLKGDRIDTKDKVVVLPNGRGTEAVVAAKLETGTNNPFTAHIESAGIKEMNTSYAKTGLTASVTVPLEDKAAETSAPAEEHDIVTAGQLSLRGGITAPLKTEAPPVPVHQFAQEMDTFITGKLEIVRKGGIAEATLTLFPENLGQVDVKITMQNGNLVAQFMTEHSGARDMLEQQMNQLRTALQAQGLQVERLEVTQSNPSNQSQWGGQQGQGMPNGGQQQGRRSKERTEENGDALLAAELNSEWKDWVAETKEDGIIPNGRFSARV